MRINHDYVLSNVFFLVFLLSFSLSACRENADSSDCMDLTKGIEGAAPVIFCPNTCPDCETFPEEVFLAYQGRRGNLPLYCGRTELTIYRDRRYRLYHCYADGYDQGDQEGILSVEQINRFVQLLTNHIGDHRRNEYVGIVGDGSTMQLFIDLDSVVQIYHDGSEAMLITHELGTSGSEMVGEYIFDETLIKDFINQLIEATYTHPAPPVGIDYTECDPETFDSTCLSDDGAHLCVTYDSFNSYPIAGVLSCRVYCGAPGYERSSLGCQVINGQAQCVCGEQETDGDGEIE